jgi:penicillin-binding protein 1C
VLHSTLDLKLQQTLERQIQSHVARERRLGIANASAMLLDTRDMSVRALVGSADFFDATIDGQVNGTQARRSPGSTLKPFVYEQALDQGLLHPQTVLKDAPTAFGPFTPENFDGRFAGPIAAREALIRSRNVPAVAVSARLAQPTLYQFLKNAGVARMQSEKHYGLGLALGGGEVTMEELVRLYAMLANRGVARPLRYVRTPEDAGGGEVRATRARAAPEEGPAQDSGCYRKRRALSSSTSCATIRDRISPGRPGPHSGGVEDRHVMGFRDAWTVGVFGPYNSRCGSGNLRRSG